MATGAVDVCSGGCNLTKCADFFSPPLWSTRAGTTLWRSCEFSLPRRRLRGLIGGSFCKGPEACAVEVVDADNNDGCAGAAEVAALIVSAAGFPSPTWVVTAAAFSVSTVGCVHPRRLNPFYIHSTGIGTVRQQWTDGDKYVHVFNRQVELRT
jgi:hypothetical protein